MYLLKREWQSGLKSLVIWLLACGLIMTMSISMFPSFAEQSDYLSEVMASFPQEMLQAINANNIDFSNPIDYFSYIYQYVLLGAGAMAILLGIHSLGKEENDKTIEFLAAKPISRSDMLVQKGLHILLSIICFSLFMSLISIVLLYFIAGAEISTDFFITVFSSTLLTQVIFSGIGLCLSTVIVKSRVAMPVALGLVFIMYFIAMIQGIFTDFEWLKYLTPFGIFNVRAVLNASQYDFLALGGSLFLLIVLSTLSLFMYNKKDFTN
ncbi:hypothetical protein EZV73_09075 [Acidaminobacter sp. JC074]|uniref:ABC transporter permease subunit n=1 Tax=Acidaminobacter sp. JC074 TaxID=2530199 RepID=UPI001F0DB8CE|nr:ABC transporter permease subunit [Acidaminobacter sp. JC074]MCH4887724.1 hypothetical protein [Acidaminobacter sp. JC074]